MIDKILMEATKAGASGYSRRNENIQKDIIANTIENDRFDRGDLPDKTIYVGGAKKQELLAVSAALIIMVIVAVIMIAKDNSGELFLAAMITMGVVFIPVIIGIIYMLVKSGKGGLVIDGDRLVIKHSGKEYTRYDIKEALYTNRGFLYIYDFWGKRFRRVKYNEVNLLALCRWLRCQGINIRVERDRAEYEFKRFLLTAALSIMVLIILYSTYRELSG